MDSETLWLGPGIESTDCALREAADPVFIKEKSPGVLNGKPP